MAKINSSQVTFIDITDSRKLDVYITSNLPTTQIYNSNTGAYSPDWSVDNLQLSADVYLDSTEITPQTIQWYSKVGTTVEELVNNSILTIDANVLSDNPIITYKCKVSYQNIEAFKEITFIRSDSGRDGDNGADGTGVTILGSYNTLEELQVSRPTGQAGDSYIVDGDLYVWTIDDAMWKNVGNIQGPAGKDGKDAKSIILNGDCQVFKASKTGAITPSTITVTAQTLNTSVTSWTYSTNGGQTFLSTAPTGVSINGNTVTITGSSMTTNLIVIKASDGTYSDTYTIHKVSDGLDGAQGATGASAPIAFLTNENITFSANAQGQISTTTITSNIVAYNGTTKTLPILGTITGVPTGMTITSNTISASNEIMLTITIANNATLGSASSNMGTISIPITSPVSTILSLTWSKVNEGSPSVNFQIYAPNGYLLTSDIQSLTLKTFAYEGDTTITSGATYQWYNLIGENWTIIDEATSNLLMVQRNDVLGASNYKCEMTYKDNIYTAVATVEDKTDTHNVFIRADARYSQDNLLYWILYATVYSDTGERDALLGSISDTAPTTYETGTYWYQVDNDMCTVTLKQYDGTQWINADDQELKYNWFLLTDTENPMTLGNQSKVKVISSNDFIHMCNIQCDVCDADYELLARNNQVLIDHTDPIISTNAPIDPVNGQIWIKINPDGTHNLCVWSLTDNKWAISSADAQNKLYVEKPTQYTMGDIWVVGADYQPNGFAVGSMLKAQYSSTIYSDDDWIAALSYQGILDELSSQMSVYKQVFSVDNNSLTMRAQNTDGTMSDLKATLTNDNLTFGYGDNTGTSLNHKQITTPTINVTNGLNISGNTPILNIGAFSLKIEENGSLSIVSNS